MTLTILGLLAILWGAATLYVGLARPASIWQIGKIQGFVGLLSERGTTIFFAVIGLAAVALGVWLLLQ